MRKHKKIIIPIIIIILLCWRFHYLFSKPVSIIETFPDLNNVEIIYMSTNGKDGVPDGETYEWDLSEYPEKQEQIKQVLEKYYYYSRPYQKANRFEVKGTSTLMRCIRKDDLESITIFATTNKFFADGGIYVLKSVKDGEIIIQEIVEIMKKQ